MNVTFIGSGNLAWHLAAALDNTDYPVREVFSPNRRNAEALVQRLYQTKISTSLDFSSSTSQIFVLAVPDEAISDVAQELILPDDAVLLHTSGSQPLGALEYAATSKTGVFYPLQTFTKKKKIDFSEIPIFIESDDASTEKLMLSMAKAVSQKVYKISSHERKALHVSAVFASNFTNHMLTIAEDIMQDHRLKFEWLQPVIVETINKALALGPELSQTGPARRGDLEILDRHVEFLKGDEAVTEIYRAVSQHIVDRYHG